MSEDSRNEDNDGIKEEIVTPSLESAPDAAVNADQTGNQSIPSNSSQDNAVSTSEGQLEESRAVPDEPKATEEKTSEFQQNYEKALEAKEQGTQYYKTQQYQSAKVKYAEASALIQNQAGDFSNEERAIIFEMSLTCSSNMSLCSWSLDQFQESIMHGRNTLLLIQALESKMPDSLIWEELQKKGMTSQKLASLKAKAYRIIGKSEMEKGDFDEAKKDLDMALKSCDDQKLAKELTDLIQKCSKKIQQQSKKQKSIWKKAFDTNSKEPDVEDLSPPNSPVRGFSPSNNSNNLGKSKPTFPAEEGTISKRYDFMWPFLFTATAVGAVGFVYFWWIRRRR